MFNRCLATLKTLGTQWRPGGAQFLTPDHDRKTDVTGTGWYGAPHVLPPQAMRMCIHVHIHSHTCMQSLTPSFIHNNLDVRINLEPSPFPPMRALDVQGSWELNLLSLRHCQNLRLKEWKIHSSLSLILPGLQQGGLLPHHHASEALVEVL